jgi:hypothetical protein
VLDLIRHVIVAVALKVEQRLLTFSWFPIGAPSLEYLLVSLGHQLLPESTVTSERKPKARTGELHLGRGIIRKGDSERQVLKLGHQQVREYRAPLRSDPTRATTQFREIECNWVGCVRLPQVI